MNYTEYFQLTQEPFSNAPINSFYFNSPTHSRALNKLIFSISNMKGLAVLVGDIGTGKTTLARKLLEHLPEEEYEAALLVIIHSNINPNWILKRIAIQMGVESPADEKATLMTQIYQRLVEIYEEGRKAVVLIDEAQMLTSKEVMEELRGLLNLEIPGKKLLNFAFFGMKELDNVMELDPPLKQRVSTRILLEPLDEESTEGYIRHRLRLSGAKRMLFTNEALKAVFKYSGGIPRLINTICDNALFEAYIAKLNIVDDRTVEIIAKDLALDRARQPSISEAETPSQVDRTLSAIDKELEKLK
ncbi:MAG: AAA family ATPase [Deltaproteobacteria bacterium]|nr:AAA family ATPase [Deltaproteobacteria bacterium]